MKCGTNRLSSVDLCLEIPSNRETAFMQPSVPLCPLIRCLRVVYMTG